MTEYDKLVTKMKNAPNAIRYEEIKKVLQKNGYELIRQKGNHTIFRNNITGTNIIIPKKNPVKECYVEDVLRRLCKNEEHK